MEKNYKKLNANWIRKGSVAFTALIVIIFTGLILHLILKTNSEYIINGIPNIILYSFIFIILLCGLLVFLYQVISIFTNKMLFTQNGIEIKRFREQINIQKNDILRIETIYERILGKSTQNRNVFKIITNLKTYEVNSHEFFGLKQAIQDWQEKNIN